MGLVSMAPKQRSCGCTLIIVGQRGRVVVLFQSRSIWFYSTTDVFHPIWWFFSSLIFFSMYFFSFGKMQHLNCYNSCHSEWMSLEDRIYTMNINSKVSWSYRIIQFFYQRANLTHCFNIYPLSVQLFIRFSHLFWP